MGVNSVMGSNAGSQRLVFEGVLTAWHREKGEELKIPPIFNHREMDLLKLWNLVRGGGGSKKVSKDKRWAMIGRHFNPPSSMTNLSFHIKRIYEKYLLPYETELHPETALSRGSENHVVPADTPPKWGKSTVSPRIMGHFAHVPTKKRTHSQRTRSHNNSRRVAHCGSRNDGNDFEHFSLSPGEAIRQPHGAIFAIKPPHGSGNREKQGLWHQGPSGRSSVFQELHTTQNAKHPDPDEVDEHQKQGIAAEVLCQLSSLTTKAPASTDKCVEMGTRCEDQATLVPSGLEMRVGRELGDLQIVQQGAGEDGMKNSSKCFDGNQEGCCSPTETSYSPHNQHCQVFSGTEVQGHLITRESLCEHGCVGQHVDNGRDITATIKGAPVCEEVAPPSTLPIQILPSTVMAVAADGSGCTADPGLVATRSDDAVNGVWQAENIMQFYETKMKEKSKAHAEAIATLQMALEKERRSLMEKDSQISALQAAADECRKCFSLLLDLVKPVQCGAGNGDVKFLRLNPLQCSHNIESSAVAAVQPSTITSRSINPQEQI